MPKSRALVKVGPRRTYTTGCCPPRPLKTQTHFHFLRDLPGEECLKFLCLVFVSTETAGHRGADDLSHTSSVLIASGPGEQRLSPQILNGGIYTVVAAAVVGQKAQWVACRRLDMAECAIHTIFAAVACSEELADLRAHSPGGRASTTSPGSCCSLRRGGELGEFTPTTAGAITPIRSLGALALVVWPSTGVAPPFWAPTLSPRTGGSHPPFARGKDGLGPLLPIHRPGIGEGCVNPWGGACL